MKKLFITVSLMLATVISSDALVTAAQVGISPLVTSQQFQYPSIAESIQSGLLSRGEIQRQNFAAQDQANKYRLQALAEEGAAEQKNIKESITDANIAGMCQTYGRLIVFQQTIDTPASARFMLQFLDTEVARLHLGTHKQLFKVCNVFVDDHIARLKGK